MKIENQAEREIETLDAFAKELLKNNSDSVVVEKLVKEKGLNQQYANSIVQNIYDAKNRKRNFWISLISGSLLSFAGIFMTIFGYNQAEDGGMYFIFYGIVAVGITTILRGFILYK